MDRPENVIGWIGCAHESSPKQMVDKGSARLVSIDKGRLQFTDLCSMMTLPTLLAFGYDLNYPIRIRSPLDCPDSSLDELVERSDPISSRPTNSLLTVLISLSSDHRTHTTKHRTHGPHHLPPVIFDPDITVAFSRPLAGRS